MYFKDFYGVYRTCSKSIKYPPIPQLDIGVNAGDLVGVVQQKDPLGNRDRWFVDNGQAQGFVQSRDAIQ